MTSVALQLAARIGGNLNHAKTAQQMMEACARRAGVRGVVCAFFPSAELVFLPTANCAEALIARNVHDHLEVVLAAIAQYDPATQLVVVSIEQGEAADVHVPPTVDVETRVIGLLMTPDGPEDRVALIFNLAALGLEWISPRFANAGLDLAESLDVITLMGQSICDDIANQAASPELSRKVS